MKQEAFAEALQKEELLYLLERKIMETEMMRKELRELIEKGDDRLIADLYDIVTDYNAVPEERMQLIMKEREDYLSGKGKSYSWEEAKAIVKSQTPNV